MLNFWLKTAETYLYSQKNSIKEFIESWRKTNSRTSYQWHRVDIFCISAPVSQICCANSRYVHLYILHSLDRLVLLSFEVIEHECDAIFFTLHIIRIFDIILVVYLILFSHCLSTHPLSGVHCDFLTKRLYVTRMIRSLQRTTNFTKDVIVTRIRFHETFTVVANSNRFTNSCNQFSVEKAFEMTLETKISKGHTNRTKLTRHQNLRTEMHIITSWTFFRAIMLSTSPIPSVARHVIPPPIENQRQLSNLKLVDNAANTGKKLCLIGMKIHDLGKKATVIQRILAATKSTKIVNNYRDIFRSEKPLKLLDFTNSVSLLGNRVTRWNRFLWSCCKEECCCLTDSSFM